MHYSVLKSESIENLNIKNDGIYVDGTIGLAGHSSEILSRIPDGFLYGFDQDEFAVLESTNKLNDIGKNFKIISWCHFRLLGFCEGNRPSWHYI